MVKNAALSIRISPELKETLEIITSSIAASIMLLVEVESVAEKRIFICAVPAMPSVARDLLTCRQPS